MAIPKSDCLDFDCANDPSCANVETDCGDGADDDGDGLIDCDDTDCAQSPSCNSVTPEQDCANGQDDDGDGLTDCDDSDCASNPICSSTEDCTNNVDDDGDGDVIVLIPIAPRIQPVKQATNRTASMASMTTTMV